MLHWRLPLFLLLAVVWQAASVAAEEQKIYRRFEYKHSFKGPHLVDRKNRLPFWTSHGNALPSMDQVRLTPSIRSMKGHIWNNIAFEGQHWEVEITLRISGRGSVGGDGMAFWFRDQAGVDGDVFGVSDAWSGLGIILDSFDNDGGMDNPMIYMIMNDGTKNYDHNRDGRSNMLSQCKRDYRNRPHPVRLRIRYFQGEVKVEYDHGNSPTPSYELCMVSDNIRLPPRGVFGMSAATGGVADDHDVLKFLTTKLSTTSSAPEQPAEESQQAIDAQKKFNDFSEEWQKQKDEYAKDHPSTLPQDLLYESPQDRMLNQVIASVQEVRDLVRNLHSSMAATGLQPPGTPSGTNAGATTGGSEAMVSEAMTRLSQEVREVLRRNQDETNSILRVHADVIKGFRVPPQGHPQFGVATGNHDLSGAIAAVRQDLQEQRDRMKTIVDQLAVVARQSASNANVASSESQGQCLSYTTLIIVIIVEALIAAVIVWRQKQKAAAAEKKFF